MLYVITLFFYIHTLSLVENHVCLNKQGAFQWTARLFSNCLQVKKQDYEFKLCRGNTEVEKIEK